MAVVADFVDVTGANALLRGDQIFVRWSRGAKEIRLKLNHARTVEEQAFVQTSGDVDRDQRPRIMDRVPFALKKAEIFFSQLANGHWFILTDRAKPVANWNVLTNMEGSKALFVIGAIGVGLAGIAMTQTKRSGVLDLVTGYQKWTKANPKPVRLMTSYDLLCRGISQTELTKERGKSPHFGRQITVYVNSIGEKTMKSGGTFPVGSVIVKEKRNAGGNIEAETGAIVLSTVMVKREKGYNSACGDWEFAAINADATKTDGVGKLESCMKCHKEEAKKDFVFKTYIGAISGQTMSGAKNVNIFSPRLGGSGGR